MKRVSYDGVAAITEDAVADAVLDFTMAVARYARYESVTFPVLVGGRTERLTLVLGPTIHLSLLTEPPGSADGSVEGADQAVAVIRRRTLDVVDPPLSVADEAGAYLDDCRG